MVATLPSVNFLEFFSYGDVALIDIVESYVQERSDGYYPDADAVWAQGIDSVNAMVKQPMNE